MNGLRTTRVVIIDDKIEEALPLIQGLGRLGIGAVYCSGLPGEHPRPRLDNIRLVFLDLHLVETGDFKAILRTTIDSLTKIVDTSSPGIGVVYWTRHGEEEKQFFEQLLAEQLPNFHPRFILPLEKVKYVDGSTDLFDELLRQVEELLDKYPAFRIGLEWEQFVHDAASTSTDMLSGIAKNDDDLLGIQAAFVKASGVSTLVNQHDALSRLFDGLNDVLLDHVQVAALRAKREEERFGQLLLDRCSTHSSLSNMQRAEINRILLTSQLGLTDSQTWPGNVYVLKLWNEEQTEFPYPTNEKDIRKCLYELYPCPDAVSENKQNAKEWKNQLKAIASSTTPCVVEITPICDHAAHKATSARLLCGLLIILPESGVEMVAYDGRLALPPASRSFAKDLFFTMLNVEKADLKGRYILVMNARQLTTMPLDSLKLQLPAFRLRHSVVVDIQAWFATHAARPGYRVVM